MFQRLQIEFVSDVSRIWCDVGLRNLEQVLNGMGDGVEVEIRFRRLELNPQTPAGGRNLVEHLQENDGWARQRTLETLAHIRRSGESVGIGFRLGERIRIYSTFDSRRLLHRAGLHGRQKELKQALFIAHFTDEGDPSDQTLLVRLAEPIGLNAAEARNVLASDAYAQDIWRAGRTGR
ncbi:hypothetical protein HFK18_12885|uniref:DsbA family protein n=1 Tax=Stenotrophomonas sp. SbOxS2 TaxID=2723885 RepID=UPI0015D0E70A|nr:DsbA family protein [Stenotrophomonas sp. SbOxS2]NYT99378.1 hypothetical protein [Stenotrophomonas sp. SbOxS2]